METQSGQASVARLYRWVPHRPDWCSVQEQVVSRQTFEPSPSDETGISIVSADGLSAHDCAMIWAQERLKAGKKPDAVCIAEFSIETIRELELTIAPDPLPDNPGHMLIPELTTENRRKKGSKKIQRKLAKSCTIVHGPFRFDADGILIDSP